MRTTFFFGVLLLCATSCRSDAGEDPIHPKLTTVDDADYSEASYQDTSLTESVLYDKILGSLVGSAIGDAMGAPTEMWDQWSISEEYGHVDSLDLVLREPSPEGPWEYNLPPGAGTDDTRWKQLMVNYVLSEHDLTAPGQPLLLAPRRFATHINTAYTRSIDRLRATEGPEPEPYEDEMRQMTWLQEWARVSRAYAADDLDAYRDASARFYGGEMACAGMLYAPVLGATYPGRPEIAYQAAYDLALFDFGYARDITGLTAALTAEAFSPKATLDTLVNVLRDVDPAGFFRSRLLGRQSYQRYKLARSIVREARRLTLAEVKKMDIRLPDKYPHDSLYYAQTRKAYTLLDKANQGIAFHAGEIHLINLTALLFSELDFQRAMEFVTNYGRDNDTVAAVTGAILGAHHGFKGLPEDQRKLVIRVNREVLGIDLEALAWGLTEGVLGRRG